MRQVKILLGLLGMVLAAPKAVAQFQLQKASNMSYIEQGRAFVGGQGFYRQSEFNFSAEFRPQLGYFFLNNLALVGRGGGELTNSGDSRNYDALAFLWYNVSIHNRISLYAATGGGFAMRRVRMLTDKAKFIVRTGPVYQTELGLTIFLNHHVMFRTAAVYSHVILNPSNIDNAGSEPLRTTTRSIVFGFQILL
jgi:hypothetical protein